MSTSTRKIFTFWEPCTNVPAYLKLCMQTWRKFLPEYEIIMLNYSNLDEWLGENYFDESLYVNFSLPKQADAIRCAILRQYGGIWFDMDTIITSDSIRNILEIDSEFTMIGRHLAFIVAKQRAWVLRKWEKGVKKNIKLYELCRKSPTARLLLSIVRPFYVRRLDRWDFLGNSILKKPLKIGNKKVFYSIDKVKLRALPEVNWAQENNSSLPIVQSYRHFYFENDFSGYALSDTGGIICLHNSWTPEHYMQLDGEEFLKQDITLSNILIKLGISPYNL